MKNNQKNKLLKIISTSMLATGVGITSIVGIASCGSSAKDSKPAEKAKTDASTATTDTLNWDKALPTESIYKVSDGVYTTDITKAEGYPTPSLPEANENSEIIIDGNTVHPTEVKMFSEENLYLSKDGDNPEYTPRVWEADGYIKEMKKKEEQIVLSRSNTFIIPGMIGQPFDAKLITLSNIEGRPGVYAISYNGVMINVKLDPETGKPTAIGVKEAVIISEQELSAAQAEIQSTADSTFFDQFAHNSPGTFQLGNNEITGFIPEPTYPSNPQEYPSVPEGTQISIVEKNGTTTSHSAEIIKYKWDVKTLYLKTGSTTEAPKYTTNVEEAEGYVKPTIISADTIKEFAKTNSNKVTINGEVYTLVESAEADLPLYTTSINDLYI